MEVLLRWPGRPLLSLLVLWVASLVVLWAARRPMLDLLSGLGRHLEEGLTALARGCRDAAGRLAERNHAALLTAGEAELRGKLARELQRIDEGFSERLGQYGSPTPPRRSHPEARRRLPADGRGATGGARLDLGGRERLGASRERRSQRAEDPGEHPPVDPGVGEEGAARASRRRDATPQDPLRHAAHAARREGPARAHPRLRRPCARDHHPRERPRGALRRRPRGVGRDRARAVPLLGEALPRLAVLLLPSLYDVYVAIPLRIEGWLRRDADGDGSRGPATRARAARAATGGTA